MHARVTPQVGAARTGLSSVSVKLRGGAVKVFHLSMTTHGVALMSSALGKKRRGLRALVTVSAISAAGGGLGQSEPTTFGAAYHVAR